MDKWILCFRLRELIPDLAISRENAMGDIEVSGTRGKNGRGALGSLCTFHSCLGRFEKATPGQWLEFTLTRSNSGAKPMSSLSWVSVGHLHKRTEDSLIEIFIP